MSRSKRAAAARREEAQRLQGLGRRKSPEADFERVGFGSHEPGLWDEEDTSFPAEAEDPGAK